MEVLYFFPKHGIFVVKGVKDTTIMIDTTPVPQIEHDVDTDYYWPVMINPDTNQIWYKGQNNCLYPIVFDRALPLPFVSREGLRDYKYHVCLNILNSTIHYHKGENPSASNVILGEVTALKKK